MGERERPVIQIPGLGDSSDEDSDIEIPLAAQASDEEEFLEENGYELEDEENEEQEEHQEAADYIDQGLIEEQQNFMAMSYEDAIDEQQPSEPGSSTPADVVDEATPQAMSYEDAIDEQQASEPGSSTPADVVDEATPQDQKGVYHFVVDVVDCRIVVLPPGYSEEHYIKLEEISGERHSTLGQQIPESMLYEDNYIYCDLCVKYYSASCLQHPLYLIKDRHSPKPVEDRAKRTLPAFFRIRQSLIPNAGTGVFTTVDVPVGSVFGPYQGLLLTNKDQADSKGYSWEIRGADGSVYLDGYDVRYANWMRYINSPRYEKEQNLVAFQYNGSVYYRVFRPILKEQELLG